MSDLKGVVVKSTGSWYNVQLDGREDIISCRILGKFRLDGFKITNPIAVGDRIVMELEGDNGIIREILPRKNYVARQSPRQKHQLHLLASNIDQAFLIITIIKPKLKPGFIDRFLLMTEPYNIPVVIVVNKSDLYKSSHMEQFGELKEIYEPIGYTVVLTSAKSEEGVKDLKDLLKDKVTLTAGQSGVGKSSLLNTIETGFGLSIGELSDYTGKGVHTTTFAEMKSLSFGGRVIDTPGIKTLSFNHLEVMDVAHNFREFFLLSEHCRYGDCTHRNEPKCAVKDAVTDGSISEVRYANYLQILDEIESQNYWERHKDY